MRAIINLLGVLLIIVGIAGLAYQGFSYTQPEKIAQIGGLQVTADTQKTIYFSPLAGGLVLIAGVALIFIGRRNGK